MLSGADLDVSDWIFFFVANMYLEIQGLRADTDSRSLPRRKTLKCLRTNDVFQGVPARRYQRGVVVVFFSSQLVWRRRMFCCFMSQTPHVNHQWIEINESLVSAGSDLLLEIKAIFMH